MTGTTSERASSNYDFDFQKLSEKEVRVLRLVHLIHLMNEDIVWHQAQAEPNLRSIKNSTELKARFEKELYEILTVEMGVRFPAMALAA